MEILPVVERLHFDLNLTNLSFLCDTWDVNLYKDKLLHKIILGRLHCNVKY